jgi:serine/threonine protein kinase
MPAPGEALGPYTLVRSLGSGGMGEVWAATAPDGAEVAVKVLPEGALGDATARARFAREVAAAQQVHDPRVQAVLGADAEAPRPWLATELVVGPTLAQRVTADGPLPGPELHALATGLADALVAVHAAGVLHRDVSPANVVLGADGPVLVDFGIARFAGAPTLTVTGTVMGTAGWVAPELLRDDDVSAAADLWSLGAVLAYAATGRPPADGSRAEVVLRKVSSATSTCGACRNGWRAAFAAASTRTRAGARPLLNCGPSWPPGGQPWRPPPRWPRRPRHRSRSRPRPWPHRPSSRRRPSAPRARGSP